MKEDFSNILMLLMTNFWSAEFIWRKFGWHGCCCAEILRLGRSQTLFVQFKASHLPRAMKVPQGAINPLQFGITFGSPFQQSKGVLNGQRTRN